MGKKGREWGIVGEKVGDSGEEREGESGGIVGKKGREWGIDQRGRKGREWGIVGIPYRAL